MHIFIKASSLRSRSPHTVLDTLLNLGHHVLEAMPLTPRHAHNILAKILVVDKEGVDEVRRGD